MHVDDMSQMSVN